MANAAFLVRELRVAQAEADAQFPSGVEKRPRLGAGHLALEEDIHVGLRLEKPARKKSGEREFGEHDQIAAVGFRPAKQRDEARHDMRARLGPCDGAELRGPDSDDAAHFARSSRVCSSTLPPASRSFGSVCSAPLWLMPFTEGTKIIAVGHIRASICASWPAPDVMGRQE